MDFWTRVPKYCVLGASEFSLCGPTTLGFGGFQTSAPRSPRGLRVEMIQQEGGGLVDLAKAHDA